jgi:hypothetical protein
MGLIRALTISILKKTRNIGFRIFPTYVKIFEGFKENHKTARKKIKENTANQRNTCPSDKSGAIPTSKETVAVLGIAKNGPIVR